MANIRVQKYVSDFSGGIFTRKTTAIDNITKHIDDTIKIHDLAKRGLKLTGERFPSSADSDKYINILEVKIRELVEARDHMVWVMNHKCG
jgi:hypothetical protein